MILYKKPYNYVALKLSGSDLLGTMDEVKDVWSRTTNNSPFESVFLDERINSLYKNDEKVEATINVFTVLIIIVATLGLFGLSSFTAEQKKKEIGVRKVLGATIPGLFVLMVREYARWVLLANVIAWPIAYYAMSLWLTNFAYRIDVPLLVFPLSGLAALLVAVIAVGYQSISAATTNPIESIKYE